MTDRRTLSLKLSLGACLVLALAASAPAQTDTLSIQQAVFQAQENNRAITISRIGMRTSESKVREVKASRLPFLNFHTHLLHAPENGYNEIVTNGGEFGLQLETGMPLYDGGIRSAQLDQALNDQDRSGVNLKKSAAEIGYAVRTAYYGVLAAKEELRIRRETVGRLEEYLSFLNQLRAGGSASQSDVLKAQVDLNNARIGVDQAFQSLRKVKFELLNAMGSSFDRTVDVVDPAPEDTSGVPAIAIENNPDVQLLEHEKASATHDITIARAERLPTLTVAGDIGVLGVTPREFRQDMGYSVLLTLELPLFNWGSTASRIEQKELAWDMLEAEVQLQKRELEAQWRVLLGDLEVSRKNLVNHASNIADAEKNYLAAKSRFAGGSGSNLEVLEAQRLLVEAKLNYNETLLRLRTDLAMALKLSGQP